MESKEQFMKVIHKLSNDKFEYLSSLFKNCPDYVIHSMRYVKMSKGQIIIQEGDPCDAVYVIISGRANGIDFQSLGNTYIFREYLSTEVIGDFELFGDIKKYRTTIRSATVCEVIKISSAAYLTWMQQDIGALFMRTRNLMNMLTNEVSEGRKYLFLNCRERLALYLVETYEKKAKNSYLKIGKKQSELADRIGFNIRTLQRNMQSLEKEEMIATESGKIAISQAQYMKLKEYIKKYLEE